MVLSYLPERRVPCGLGECFQTIPAVHKDVADAFLHVLYLVREGLTDVEMPPHFDCEIQADALQSEEDISCKNGNQNDGVQSG